MSRVRGGSSETGAGGTRETSLQQTDDVEVCGYFTTPLDPHAVGTCTRSECDRHNFRPETPLDLMR